METERFIAVINREKFDYTKWQRERFDHISSDEFNEAAVAYSRENPFCKKSVRLDAHSRRSAAAAAAIFLMRVVRIPRRVVLL